MFHRHSFTALLALPLFANAAVLPIISSILPLDEVTGILGRQATTITPVVNPVIPIGNSIVSNRQVTDSSAVSAVLPALRLDEETDGTAIRGSQGVTVSRVISPVLPRGGSGNGAACGASGTVQCCDSTESASDLSASTVTLFGLLGVVVSDLTANVGVTCSPISVIGVGGTSCSSQTVCCENNSFNGVVALGCTPINVGL
ncbi:fungal hydrophobin-domain-containing protein [Armillaria fumosa]|nr:fungal hydrophobin-domain-containing protein [Armillaria fumosa]